MATALNPAGTGLVYSATIGGSQNDFATGIDVDSSGTAYVSGYTFSSDFPTTAGAFDTTFGVLDAFVLKVNPGGATLAYATFLGGTGGEFAWAIAADGVGNAYVTGVTSSANFPTTPGAFDTTHGGIANTDGFVTKLNPSGNALVYSAFLGGANVDNAFGIAVDGLGNAYVTGDTASADFPTHACAFDTSFTSRDAFVTKINASGTALDYSSSLGAGIGDDVGKGIALDLAGNAYVTGSTNSSAFPTTPGASDTTYNGGGDAFVAKIVDDSTIPGPSCGGNTPPSNVILNLNSSVDENGTATLTGSFTDPDAADTHTVVINWGPGEGTTTLNLAAGVTTFSASHTYLDDSPAGTSSDVYNVSATVTEASGSAANRSTSITVHNVAPTASNDSATTNEDEAVAIAIFANDSDVAGPLDPLQIDSVTNGSQGVTAIDNKGTPETTDDEIIYTPNPGANGNDSFTYSISDGDGGIATATVSVQIQNLVDLSGRVFDDKDNDGAYQPEGGDVGIGGVTVQLFDESSGALVATQTTSDDGTFFFDVSLGAGTYKLVAAQAAGFLDGREFAGNLGGTVDNTRDSNQITGINVGEPGTTADAIDYLFAEILPSQALGLAWLDADNDGEVNFGESVIPGVAVELTGLDDRGQAVSRSATTDANGIYAFLDLRPSDASGYAIRELQPAGYVDGLDILGTVNGVVVGNNSANDTFTGVVLPRPNSLAENYNFGERPPADGGVQHGQTATIGYWQNKNGQNLIKSVSGGPTSTQLGNWLAFTFPNMYGTFAGVNNLAGKTNANIAAFYKTLFARTASSAAGGGPPKMDAQVMATALAAYVTNQSLAGTTATSYGFLVTAGGVGTRTFNGGSNGAAFGVANNTSVTVLDLLLAVNNRSRNGLLYDLDGDGDANDSVETSYRAMANNIFSAINEAGHI